MTSGVRAARCLRRCFGSEWGSVETTPQRPKILKPPPNHPPQNKPSNRNRASASLARTDFQSRPQSQFMFRAWTLQHPALRSSATHNRSQPHARDQNDCEPAVDLLSSSPSRVYIAVVLLRAPALLAPFWPQAGLSTACDVQQEVAAVDNQLMRVCCGAIPCSCLEKRPRHLSEHCSVSASSECACEASRLARCVASGCELPFAQNSGGSFGRSVVITLPCATPRAE